MRFREFQGMRTALQVVISGIITVCNMFTVLESVKIFRLFL